jgi:integrase
MPTIELTDTKIERLRAPDPSGKQVLWWDAKTRGLGVLCSGTTTSKTFVVQHKLADRRTRRITVGPIAIGLKKARADAAGLIADILKGGDPKAERRAAVRRARTLREALDAYLTDNKTLSERSRAGYRAAVENYLTAWLDAPIRDINTEAVFRRHAEIAGEVAARNRGRSGGGPATGQASADGVMRELRAIWYHQAELDPTMPPNPVKMKKGWFKVQARNGSVAREQLPSFFAAVDGLDSRTSRDYLLLLLFTGLRRGEAAGLRWSEIDFAARLIRLPAARTKTKRGLDLPMSGFVRDLLVARRAIGVEGPFVFTAASRSGHVEEPKFALAQVATACGVAVTAHDLRRTFTTIANGTVSGRDARALVNHSVGGNVHDDYDQVTAEELRAAAQKVGERIEELCGLAGLPQGVEKAS